MHSTELSELDRLCLWHPYTRRSTIEAGPLPIIVRGEGVHLHDADGRRYVDAVSSWWACNLGHGHPRVVEAIRRQAGELQHSILGNLSHPRAIELAVRLVGLFPTPRRRVFFAGDGASAVEAALKIAVQYWHNRGRPEKHRFCSLEEGYHGDTLGAVSVGYIERFHRPFRPLLFPAWRAEAPRALECFHSMRRLIEEHAGELAAVIVEPLCQGAAGMRIYAPAYLRELAALCREREVLLIADEIAVGFGRTGRFFAFEHAGVDPDITCLGKGLTAGYLPMSATVVGEAIYETFCDMPDDHTFYHGHTFAGNPIAAAAALATLDVYEEEDIVARSRAMGAVLGDQLRRFRELPLVRDVRSLGMIGVVELESAPGRAEAIRRAMVEAGFLIRPLGDVFYLMLPLTCPEAILGETVEALYREVAAAC